MEKRNLDRNINKKSLDYLVLPKIIPKNSNIISLKKSSATEKTVSPNKIIIL